MKVYLFLLCCLVPVYRSGLQGAPVKGHASGSKVTRSANLDLARIYEGLRKWADAEKYYQEAAKEDNPAVWQAALLGVGRVRAAADGDSQELAGGQYYQAADVRDKAEDQYVAALKSSSDAVRKIARQELNQVGSALRMQRKFDLLLQYVKYAAAVVGSISLVLLIVGSVQASLRIRRSIDMAGFTEAGEKAEGKMPFWLSYVRSRIRSLVTTPPSQISPLIASPPMLYLALPDFRDELPEPEKEVETGGVKIPLASFIGLYMKPKVKIIGGWTAPAGTNDGKAFAAVYRRSALRSYSPWGFVMRPITAAAPDDDLEAFAYDVYVKAVESHAL